MNQFIELTQHADTVDGFVDRKIKVHISHIEFYFDKHIVLNHHSIDVLESYDEITELIWR